MYIFSKHKNSSISIFVSSHARSPFQPELPYNPMNLMPNSHMDTASTHKANCPSPWTMGHAKIIPNAVLYWQPKQWKQTLYFEKLPQHSAGPFCNYTGKGTPSVGECLSLTLGDSCYEIYRKPGCLKARYCNTHCCSLQIFFLIYFFFSLFSLNEGWGPEDKLWPLLCLSRSGSLRCRKTLSY